MPEDKRTIGEILRQAREEQKLSLDEIVILTKVRLKYLSAIEADQFDILPSVVQLKGFVRSYARALDLDPAPLLIKLRSSLDIDEIQDSNIPLETPSPVIDQKAQPMGEIGQILKSQRERLGLSISNVENQIFIPERYLQAIEDGNLDQLPSTVQGKGMVKNFAQFLGLDPDPLLMNYADVLQDRLSESRDDPDPKTHSSLKASIRRFLASPTILWVGVVLLISIVSIWSGWLIFGNKDQGGDFTPTIPGVADILLPTSTFSPTPPEVNSTPGEIEVDITSTPGLDGVDIVDLVPTATSVITGNEKVQVQLIIVQRTWVRVIVDNILAFEGRLLAGSVKLFGGEINIEVLTGNASGVEVIFNQQDLGAMGLYGEVIDRVYTADGIATPTPTISPTPTPSDTPEASLTPTSTLEP